MKKVLDLRDHGSHYFCKKDEKAKEKPYRLYMDYYEVTERGFKHRTKQIARFDDMWQVLQMLCREV